jgi:hypothetical protein
VEMEFLVSWKCFSLAGSNLNEGERLEKNR